MDTNKRMEFTCAMGEYKGKTCMVFSFEAEGGGEDDPITHANIVYKDDMKRVSLENALDLVMFIEED